VVSVSAVAHLPLSGGRAGRSIAAEGQPDPGPDKQPGSNYSVACPGLLRTLGIPLLAGRDFTFADTVGAPDVALVNEAFAKSFWRGDTAVGKRFKIGLFGSDGPWITVVGVFRNLKYTGLDDDEEEWLFRPYSQAGWPFMSIVTKTAAAPEGFVTPVKRALSIVEPAQPVTDVTTMQQVLGSSVSSRRFPMLLLSSFAALALILAAVGIAGVVGYSVVQRTQEIGVRMALGAEPRDVVRLVVGHSLWWTLGGVVAGLIAAVSLLRFLGALVYGVEPADPYVLGTVSVLLVAVATAASYLPARRATRVDPVTALRCE
jgi:putative ABC transport system permease protein